MNACPDHLRHRLLRHAALPEIWLYLLIAIAYGVRAWQVFNYNPMQHLWSDPLRHWTHASEVLHTGPMAFFDPIGYQIWLSVIQRITYGDTFLIACYATALSWVTPWLWYRAFGSLNINNRLCLIGWAILAWLPSWIAIYSYFMNETLFLPMLGWSIWVTARADRKRTTSAFALAVTAWTLTTLVRGIAAPMAGIAMLLIWLRQSDKLQKAFISLVIAGLLLGPIGYRNYQNVGLWPPFGNAWLNRIYAASGKQTIQMRLVKNGAYWIYGYGSPSISEKPFSPLSDWTTKRKGQVDISIDLTQGESDWEREYQQNALQNAGWLYGENILYLLAGPSWPDNDSTQILAKTQIASRWVWAPLLLGVIIWSCKDWQSCRARPLIWLLMVVWFSFQGLTLLTVNEGRYRKPFEGLLAAQLLLLIDSRPKHIEKIEHEDEL